VRGVGTGTVSGNREERSAMREVDAMMAVRYGRNDAQQLHSRRVDRRTTLGHLECHMAGNTALAPPLYTSTYCSYTPHSYTVCFVIHFEAKTGIIATRTTQGLLRTARGAVKKMRFAGELKQARSRHAALKCQTSRST
jgi:hypothetical protein